MKKVVFIVLLATFGYASYGQIPKWTDVKIIAGQSFDYGNAIKVDNKDNYYLAVSFQNPLNSYDNQTLPDICNFIQPVRGSSFYGALLRFDSMRNLTLSITIEKATLNDIVVDSLGNLYVAGALQYGAYRNAFLKKYSSTGKLIWTKSVESSDPGVNSDNVITSLDIYKDGSMVLCGFSYGRQTSILGQQALGPINFITKISSDGEILWTKNFSSDLGIGAHSVKFDATGDVLVAGNEKAVNFNINAVISKLSYSTGNIIWKKQLPSGNTFVPMANAISTYDDFYVFGGVFGGHLSIEDTTINSSGGLDVFLVQCDKNGNVKWIKQGGSTGRETLSDLITDEQGVTYLTGGFSDGFQINGASFSSKGNTDVYIGALDKNGKTLWMLTGGSEIPHHKDELFYDENGVSIAIDSKKQVQVVGTTRGSGSFGSLLYKASEDVFSNAFWVTLGSTASNYTVKYPCDRTSVLDTSLTIEVNPNPFSQSLTISNSNDLNIDYKLSLYNNIGQKIEESFFYNANTITVENWSLLAAGIYLLKIETDDYSKTFKLVKK